MPELSVALLMNALVVPVSVPTATAPAMVMLPSLVFASLFFSVFWLSLLPPLSEEPPGEDFAVVVMVRSNFMPGLRS